MLMVVQWFRIQHAAQFFALIRLGQVEANLGHGESLYVVGDCAALGDNDPSSAVQLFTSPADYPKWTSDYGKKYTCLRGPWPVLLSESFTVVILMLWICILLCHAVSIAANRDVQYSYVVFTGSKVSLQESFARKVHVKKSTQVRGCHAVPLSKISPHNLFCSSH
jgi:hypothetical protein